MEVVNGVGQVGVEINVPQVQLAVGWGAPLTHPVPVVGNLAATIPQV
jgi:hypothetical protein